MSTDALTSHRPVGVIDVLKVGLEIEYPTRIDAAGQDVLEELGDVGPRRHDAAPDPGAAVDDRLGRDLDAMGCADTAGVR